MTVRPEQAERLPDNGLAAPSAVARPRRRPVAWAVTEPDQFRRAVSRGRLGTLALLLALLGAGVPARDHVALLAAVLGVALAVAVGWEVAWRWASPRLALLAGLADGLTAGALVYAAGPAAGFDLLFPLAMVALTALPSPSLALALAIADVALYAGAAWLGPAFAPARDVGPVVVRLALLAPLAVGVYWAARARAGGERTAEALRRQIEEEGLELARARGMEVARANLIAMLGHDLRTPLTSIKGFSQLMLRQAATPETAGRYAEVILAETNRAIRTVGDAVDLARTELSGARLDLQPVDLAPIVEAAVAALAHHDPEGRLRLAVERPLPTIRADASRVERIMVNLIGSALRYSRGSTPIEVGAAPDGQGVIAWVRDEGGGIPPERFAHIFDLEADDPQGGGEFRGSGLGLYISKVLVEAHGGRLWVESTAGSGSRFAFTLRA